MGADIALFPEMWSNGYNIYGRPAEEWKAEAVPSGGSFVRSFQRLAGELEMAIGVTLLEEYAEARAIRLFFLTGSERESSFTPKCIPVILMWSGS